MLIKVIKKQTIFLLKQKEASLTFILLLAVVLGNYITNVLTFRGTDVSQMYQPMKLLALSLNKVYFSANIQLLIVMIYPILVAVPAGFSYTKEQQTKEEVYMIYRLGKNRYLQSKLWASFFTTTIVFTVPFMLEILMNMLSFPMNAIRDLSNLSIYNTDYATMVHNYIGSAIYIASPGLYAILMILVFGNKLYGHFCTASIYVFSRCPNRMKWYGKELLQLINLICIFELVFLSTTAIASVLRYQVIFSVGGFILLGCHALIFMLWNFTLVLLVNLLAINIGSSAAFTLVMVVQMTCTAALSIINILTKIQIKQDIIDVFLWLNPVAHTVLGWHRSTLLEVELANSRYSLNLVTSILIPALFCIVTVVMGGLLIQKKDLLAEDMEMETI